MLSWVAATLLALAPPPGATIQGVVRAEGSREPIPAATVTIAELERSVQADAHGFFVLAGVPEGRWRIEAGALGYRGHALTVVTRDGGMVRLDFELPLRPVQLSGVFVRGAAEDAHAEFIPSAEPGPGVVRVRAQTLRTVPGLAEPDALRALQMLPSVAAISDFSTALYVRGGAADQNLLLLDGMPLFNPYHVGGLFSALPMDAISTVDLWAGALPAAVGDRLSSAVAIRTRDGGRDRTRAAAGLGLISSNLTLDGPLGSGSYLVAGRRTYLDAISRGAYGLGLLDFTMPYGFSDAYLKATHPVGALGAISLSGYWNAERIATPPRMTDRIGGWGDLGWGSRLLALNYRRPLAPALLLQARAGYTDFRGSFDAWGEGRTGYTFCTDGDCHGLAQVDTSQIVLAHTRTSDVVLGAELSWFRRAHTLRGGVQLDRYGFDHALRATDGADPDFFPLFDTRSSLLTLAGYAEDEWRAHDRLGVRGGVRLLAAGRLGHAVMPRAGLRWQAAPSLALTLGGGLYAQPLRTMKDDESVVASLIAYDVLTAQPDEAGLARGGDVVAGVEFTGERTRLRIDAFRKTMDRLALPAEPDDPIRTPPLVIDDARVGRGSARGVELSARRLTDRLDLGVAYALSFAGRSADGEAFTPRFERRHRADLSAELRAGEHSLLSARLVLASGQPYTPAVDVMQALVFDPVTGEWTGAGARLVLGDKNSARLPGYARLDVAARRSFRRAWFGQDGTMTPYVQFVNVLNHRNVLIADPQPHRPGVRYWPQLPILPTFGVEWRF